ncbi:acyltransferase domain-containing protein [Streptomyces violascens]|uniref:acyltransferase domain-containing protein n=1 Tax=Streptomyces violascens TaxID=67381 RepID=UPI001CFED500|nr:acyltransferase domain-containing protein [Streptomyces violascens]
MHLFPGQGDFRLTPLLRASGPLRRAAREVLEEVDQVSARHGLPLLAPWLLGATPPSGRDLAKAPPGVMQLAQFGASLAVHRALCERFGTPDAVVGVSFGEIAALTAAGAFEPAEGAEIAWELGRILIGTCPGGLTLLGCGDRAACSLLSRAAAQDTAVACVNDDRETVVSGPVNQLQRVEKAAAGRGVEAVRLRLPFSSHHPALRRQSEEFTQAVRRHPARPTRCMVVSAVARRCYVPGEDLAARLADCLVLPAHVPDAVTLAAAHLLPGQALRLYEAGTGSALSQNARRILAGRPATVHAPLADLGFFSW